MHLSVYQQRKKIQVFKFESFCNVDSVFFEILALKFWHLLCLLESVDLAVMWGSHRDISYREQPPSWFGSWWPCGTKPRWWTSFLCFLCTCALKAAVATVPFLFHCFLLPVICCLDPECLLLSLPHQHRWGKRSGLLGI